jgi:hypothetical protein
MSKTLFTAALAFVLSIGGFALSAADSITLNKDFSLVKLVVQTNIEGNLIENLTRTSSETSTKMPFGYVKNNGDFVPLQKSMTEKEVVNDETKSTTFVLGKFKQGDTFQFGYSNGTDFEALSVASDPAFNAGYNIDGFYHLDFGEDPFNGKLDIMVMGEPLPASTVTMLVALAAAAALLLFRNRKTRARFSAQA